ncbi:MAG: SUMF1/EgtB/PvdO family nonheme iron enzyme [Candidatus Omnitrophica bacterium]|nr:SUMF1/EgtB/PvdO family nonheme iron enzyme [Candidatus Omnitrophota bacterium]
MPCFANNLTISNVALGTRNPANKTVSVQFDISWDNSWKTKINYDAAWLTVRLNKISDGSSGKKLCKFSAAGVNPSGITKGSSSNIDLVIPTDKVGVFIRPSQYGVNSKITSTGVQVTVDYGTCGFSDADEIKTSIFGLEMVYVPQGSFYAGDGVSTGSFKQGAADVKPWHINSGALIAVTGIDSNGYYYVSGGNDGENATGSSFDVSGEYPKGYNAFFVMKYEVNEGEWVEFVNSLAAADRNHRDITDNLHKNSDSVKYRNTVQCSGSPLVCSTSRPNRPVNYLAWQDLAAFLDWMALRPISELEYEKIARGPVYPIEGDYAWGNTSIEAASIISNGAENGLESVQNSANAVYGNTSFSGGDASESMDQQKGALRNGIFATAQSNRAASGAGYYGVLELSGNLKEMVVTVGNPYGRAFAGINGDGVLSTEASYEGNANQSDWPGLDEVASRGITGVIGTGLRGGSWDSTAERLRISDRAEAALSVTDAKENTGGRGARTYDGE